MQLSRRRFLEALIVSSLFFPKKAYGIDFPFPNLEGYTEQGINTHLSSYLRKKPLLLHAWGAYCSPCMKDMPTLNTLEETVAILGLYDMAGQDVEKARASVEKIKEAQKQRSENMLLPKTSLQELNQTTLEVTRATLVFPTYYLLDESGICVHMQTGVLTEEKLKDLKSKIRSLQ